VEPEESGGSCFICTVKVNAERGVFPIKKKPPELSLEGRRVLVVDDTEVNRIILFVLLESSGAVLDDAQDGQEALEKVLQKNYDLVLMDLHMPGMDGFEASRRIRESGRSGTDTLPIIAVTADTGGDVIPRCIKAGMNGYVAKPIDKSVLFATIAESLSGTR
jgi:CheY-like chemotaxis protein